MRQLLLRAGAPVPLGSRAFLLLLALVEQVGELVSKETLTKCVWPDLTVEESNLRAHVAALRRSLGCGVGGERYIATVAGRGYRFVAPIRTVRPLTSTVASPKPRHNLVERLTRIIGRESLIEDLDAQLRERRLVTLTGPGGIGKTTVAVATAHRQHDLHPDGVWLIDLAPTAGSALLLAVVASTLGLAIVSDDATEALTDFLQDKRMLLVLDGCDHLLDAAAQLVETILRSAPGVRLIVTSREPLATEGEWVQRLSPLEAPSASTGLTAAEALAYPAVQLFAERAAAGSAGFALSDEDAPFAADICRRLDGIALAIELGAGQIEAFGIRGLAALIDDHFLLLMRGRRTALARHQTLGATLDWSYRRLPDAERQLLRRLAVFAGAFTLEAACAVAADATLPARSVADLLSRLVAKSLVSAQVRTSAPQYRLLDATRLYALEQLHADAEFEAAARRHADFFLELLGQTSASPTFVADNLRAALTWAHAAPGETETAVKLTLAAIPRWFSLGLIDECRTHVEHAIRLLEATPSGEYSLMCLQGALVAVLMNTRSDGGPNLERACRKVLALAEALDDHEYQLKGLWGLWVNGTNTGRHREALEIARQFAAVAERSPCAATAHAVASDRMMGISLYYLGDHAEAGLLLDRVLAACPSPELDANNLPYQFDQRISALCHRARVLLIVGSSEQAIKTVDASVAEARAMGHLPSLAYALSEGGCAVALVTGDLDLADTYADLLIECSRGHGMDLWQTLGRFYKGWLLARRGHPSAGLAVLRESFAKLRDTRFGPVCAMALAGAAASTGDPRAVREAMIAVEESLRRSTEGEELCCHPELIRAKADLLIAKDGLDAAGAARKLLFAAAELARSQGALRSELRIAINLARIDGALEVDTGARTELARVLGRFRGGDHTIDLVEARRLLDPPAVGNAA